MHPNIFESDLHDASELVQLHGPKRLKTLHNVETDWTNTYLQTAFDQAEDLRYALATYTARLGLARESVGILTARTEDLAEAKSLFHESADPSSLRIPERQEDVSSALDKAFEALQNVLNSSKTFLLAQKEILAHWPFLDRAP